MYLKRKYQVGGVAYTPYLPAQTGSPQESTSTSGGTSKSSSPEKISGTIKGEIVDLLKENGIPSDVSVFLSAANTFLNNSKNLSSKSIFGGDDDDYDISDLIKIQQLVNDVKYNNNLRNKAVEQVTKENAGSEVAVTDRGQIYVQNEDGKIVKITPKEYKENAETYIPLTNDQLLYLREHNSGMAFDTSTLNDLQNTIGMASITKYLRDTITAFGSDTVKGYTTKDAAVNRGIEALMHSGPDGYYQFTNKEELRDVNRALRYLYNGMSENAKNLIKAKTAVEGGDPSDPSDVYNLLLHALYEHTSRETSVSFDKPASDYDPNQSGRKGGSEKETKVKNTYLYRVASLNGPRRQVTIAPKGSKIADTGLMVTQGIVNGAVVDNQDQRLGNMSVAQMLQTAEAVKAGDASTIVLGNRVLTPGEYGGVMFDSNQECNTVLLPYTYDQGRVVPDFDTFEKYNELQRAIAGKFSMPETEVNRLAKSLGLDSSQYNYDSSTNSLTLTQTMYFLSFGAIVGDDTIDLSKDNKRFLEKLDKSEGKHYEKPYENMLKYGKIDRKKSDMKIGKYDTSGANDFYRGMLWIAMPDAYRGAHLSMDEYIDRDDVNNFGRRTELRQQQIEANNAYQQVYGNIGSFKNE